MVYKNLVFCNDKPVLVIWLDEAQGKHVNWQRWCQKFSWFYFFVEKRAQNRPSKAVQRGLLSNKFQQLFHWMTKSWSIDPSAFVPQFLPIHFWNVPKICTSYICAIEELVPFYNSIIVVTCNNKGERIDVTQFSIPKPLDCKLFIIYIHISIFNAEFVKYVRYSNYATNLK